MDTTDIIVPNLPESVNTATVVNWNKKIGDYIKQDEIIVEIETDKIILEVPALCNGVLESIYEVAGNIVHSKQILGKVICKNNIKNTEKNKLVKINTNESNQNLSLNIKNTNTNIFSPGVRRLIAAHDIKEDNVKKEIINHRIDRQDIEAYIQEKNKNSELNNKITKNPSHNMRDIKRVKMNHIRKCIANRLLHVVQNTAILTTFNEVNMAEIIKLRKKYGNIFKEKHGVRLGFMSFYVKAVISSLQKFPIINAAIDNEDIIYYNYFDINIAVSSKKGLITPVLKNANLMHMYEIENKIKEFSNKAEKSELDIEDLIGGTFTITNGGVFGSLLSTPIINPPQSAILGIHHIKERPIALNNKIVIQPMMYIALSYDHRIIDGKDAINFLLNIKNILEDFNLIILNL